MAVSQLFLPSRISLRPADLLLALKCTEFRKQGSISLLKNPLEKWIFGSS